MDDTKRRDLVGMLQDHFISREEGWAWAFFHDHDSETGVAAQIEGAMPKLDDELIRNFAHVLASTGADEVLLAITRVEGRPHEADRELWRALSHLMTDGSTELLDLVVVGPDRIWSARQEERERGAAA